MLLLPAYSYSGNRSMAASGTFRAIACEVVNAQVGGGVSVRSAYYLTEGGLDRLVRV